MTPEEIKAEAKQLYDILPTVDTVVEVRDAAYKTLRMIYWLADNQAKSAIVKPPPEGPPLP